MRKMYVFPLIIFVLMTSFNPRAKSLGEDSLFFNKKRNIKKQTEILIREKKVQKEKEKERKEIINQKKAEKKRRIEESIKAEENKNKIIQEKKEAEKEKLEKLKEKELKEKELKESKGEAYKDNLLIKSFVRAETINNFLKGTLMEGSGKAFKEAEKKTGINATFLVALAIHESNWGKSRIATEKNNLFGYGAYNESPYESAWTFKDQAEGIFLVAEKLKENYLSKKGKFYTSLSVEGVNVKYCLDDEGNPSFKWSKGIKYLMKEMEELEISKN